MFRKIVFGSILAVAVCVMVAGPVMAAVVLSEDNTSSFTVTVAGTGVTLKASANVYVNVSIDDDTNSTSATIMGVNGKGSRMFALDSDGGPLYYSSVGVGTTSMATVVSTTGTDDIAVATGWSAL